MAILKAAPKGAQNLATALAAPPPALASLSARIQTAIAAVHGAEAARTEALGAAAIEDRKARLASAERKHDRAVALADVARHTGDDAPSSEEIADLRSAVDAARAELADVARRKAAFDAIVAEKMATLADLTPQLPAALDPWLEQVRDAARAQMEVAAHLAADAATAFALTGYGHATLERATLPDLGRFRPIEVQPVVELPAEISAALRLDIRARRALGTL